MDAEITQTHLTRGNIKEVIWDRMNRRKVILGLCDNRIGYNIGTVNVEETLKPYIGLV